MFGLPGQTLAQWEATLRKTIALGPEHISTYCLTYEEDTEFFARQARGEFREDPDSDARFLESAMEMLESAGFEHYEISNYARDGLRLRRTIADTGRARITSGWGRAHFPRSVWSDIRMSRITASIPDRVLAGDSAVSSTEVLTPADETGERIALSLRTGRGIPSAELDPWPDERREFEELGLLKEADGNLVLTRQGKLLADSVAAAFV